MCVCVCVCVRETVCLCVQDLDDAHQLALLNQMLQKPAFSWTSHDLQRALRLAPHVIDDDFLDDFSDELLEEK